MSNHLHCLRIIPESPKMLTWVCVCGAAGGSGPTEEACEASYARHVRKEAFRRIERVYY